MNGLSEKRWEEIEAHMKQEIKEKAIPLSSPKEIDPLIEYIGDSRFVLLGEASHGTHEYYTWRTEITKRLIEEQNFSFIAVEGDWPCCYKLNRYVKGYPETGENAVEVLMEFDRWPTWMWANWEVVELAEWLRAYNMEFAPEQRVGFYGLDVYSLVDSLKAILDYLKETDFHAYESAKKTIECFEPFGYNGRNYGFSTSLTSASCQKEVVNLLKEIRGNILQYNTDYETVFSTEQNALVALHAENYYRKMVNGGPDSWNIRDNHMVETLNRLIQFHGNGSKAIVWEHNTHIGDARATDMTDQNMVNVGELVSQMYKSDGVVKVGFGSYKGTVIASDAWGEKMKKMKVPKGAEGSWEKLLHDCGHENLLLLMYKWENDPMFKQPVGHRAIGVVYDPKDDRLSTYVPSVLPQRYDAFIFIDETKALHPLKIDLDNIKEPDTYPWGV